MALPEIAYFKTPHTEQTEGANQRSEVAAMDGEVMDPCNGRFYVNAGKLQSGRRTAFT